MLARTAGRARELAVRTTLGARRARVVRLVVAEGVCVAAAGAVAGVAVGAAGLAALRDGLAGDLPHFVTLAVDARAVAFMALLALAAGVATALVPALRATGGGRGAPALAAGGRAGDRGASADGRRLRAGLVVAELALTLALLAGAGLLAKSVARLQAVDVGFRPAGALRAQVYLPGARYDAPAARSAYVRDAAARLAALPGVAAVGAADILPLTGGYSSGAVVPEGGAAGAELHAHRRGVTAGYFAAVGLPLVAGRGLTPAEAADTAGAAVVVSEALARRAWPGRAALGRRLALGAGPDARRYTVVGVARDARLRLADAPDHELYLPHAASGWRSVNLVVRVRGGAGADARALAALPAVRAALRGVDPGAPVEALEPVTATVRAATADQRLWGGLFGAFAAAALALATVGVYGVVAYQASRRTRELGVRVALGARPGDVRRLVVGAGARLAGLGVALGLALAAAVTRALAGSLYGVSPTDPAVLAAVAAALGGAALLASWLPARRAARVAPTEALRAE